MKKIEHNKKRKTWAGGKCKETRQKPATSSNAPGSPYHKRVSSVSGSLLKRKAWTGGKCKETRQKSVTASKVP